MHMKRSGTEFAIGFFNVFRCLWNRFPVIRGHAEKLISDW
jgi:hypothetical protein